MAAKPDRRSPLARRAAHGDELRSEVLGTRLTLDEHAGFEAEASEAGLTKSAYLALRLTKLKTRTKTHTSLHPVLYAELSRIANNVNQLTRPRSGQLPLPPDHPLISFQDILEILLRDELAKQRETRGGANDNTRSAEKPVRPTRMLTTRVTKDFYDDVHNQAREAGLKAGPFIHAQLFGKPVILHKHEAMAEASMSELKDLGEIINTFARARNRDRAPNTSDILAAFRAVYTLLGSDPVMRPRLDAANSSLRSTQSDDRSRTPERQVVQRAHPVPDAR